MSDDKEFSEEVVEQLKRSKQQQGYLEKVKVDQDGNVLSGRHRKRADSDWPEEVVEVQDDLDRELKIIHYNIQRRVPMEETQKRLVKIAEILETKEVPKETIASEVAKLVPYSDRYVRELLPDKYKMVQMAREPQIAEVVPQILVECDRCHMGSRDVTEYKGLWLCQGCLEEAKRKPVKERLEPARPLLEPKVYKPPETWAHRKARMQVPVSSVDEDMFVLLQNSEKVKELGYQVEFQKYYCILGVRSDVTLKKPGREIAVFWQSPLHLKRQDRDEANLSSLAKKGVEAWALPFKTQSQSERRDLLKHVEHKISE